MVTTTPLSTAVGAIGLRNPDSDNGLWPVVLPFTQFWVSPAPPGNVPEPIRGEENVGEATLWLDNPVPWSTIALRSDTVNQDSTEDGAFIELILPQNYIAGEDITVTMNSQWVGTGTTAGVFCYNKLQAYKPVIGENAEQITVTPSTEVYIDKVATEYAFVLTGTGLAPGDRLLLLPFLGPSSEEAVDVFALINEIVVS